jgi:hypothetical protein
MGGNKGRALRAKLACVHILCALGLALGQEAVQSLQRTPAFLWSPEAYIKLDTAGESFRVSYEVSVFFLLLRSLAEP